MRGRPSTIPGGVADASKHNWVDHHAPAWLKPYARLARWDRPIGIWLLFWPCAYSLALSAISAPQRGMDWTTLGLMFVGALLMRGAGCTFNDIVDRDIDKKVARTRSRPLASGAISTRQAAIFLVLQSLLAFVILLQFNLFTIVLGIASLLLVAVYPFMKRVTWWPQLFLGLAFSWGALMGWATQFGSMAMPPLLLYAGSVLWTIGYDTIYAMQDVEDDALIGVKSTARLFGRRTRALVAAFYAAGLILWLAAGLLAGAGAVFLLLSTVPAFLLGRQLWALEGAKPGNALRLFQSNKWVGASLALALLLESIA